MSAYMVDRDHIKFLITAAQSRRLLGPSSGLRWYHNDVSHELKPGDRDAASKAGQMLWDANAESINARYPDTVGKPERMPGPIDEPFVYAHSSNWPDEIDMVQVLKAIRCFNYQACEYDGWYKSEAYAFLESLQTHAIMALPGYEEAAWGAPELRASPRRR
jgi:hypothetical protein